MFQFHDRCVSLLPRYLEEIVCKHLSDPEVKYKEVPLMLADDGQYTVKRVVFEEETLLKDLASINALPGTLLNVHRGDTLEVDNEYGTLKVPHPVSMSLRLSR